MIGLMCLKKLMLTKPLIGVCVIFVINDCHDLMQKATCFNDVGIASVKLNDYTIHFGYMTKNEAVNL